jgi:hypothetical protein
MIIEKQNSAYERETHTETLEHQRLGCFHLSGNTDNWRKTIHNVSCYNFAMERMMPPQAEKANLNKTPFEKIEEEKGIKDFLTTSFNDKTIISNINSGDVLVFDNNEGKNRELLDQYGQAMNLSYQGDINDQNYLFDLENQLYLRAHPININDFKHVKNVSIEDIQLFKKVFGSKKFNFDLNTIGTNLDEVLIFLRYTKNANEKDFERILKYKKEYGVSTFLSLIHGGKEMGDKILILGEKLPKDSAEVLFAKYAELVDIANNVSVELKNTIGKDAPANFEESVRGHLLIKGKDMLSMIMLSQSKRL